MIIRRNWWHFFGLGEKNSQKYSINQILRSPLKKRTGSPGEDGRERDVGPGVIPSSENEKVKAARKPSGKKTAGDASSGGMDS